MAKEKKIEISVKTVFAGNQSKEQVFYDLLLRERKTARGAYNLELTPQTSYNDSKVFPAYTQPKGENRCEQ